MTASFDTEILIEEVRKRPELWDPSTEAYKDKNRKAEAWVEVCYALVEDYEDLSVGERSSVGKDVQARWRSIRDSYSKDCKKRNSEIQLGSKGLKCRPYIFSKQLSFLNKVLEHKPTTNSSLPSPENKPTTNNLLSSHDTKEWIEITPQIFTSRQSTASSGPSEKRQRLSFEDKMIRFLEACQQEKEDDDRAFFSSMLPAVRTLSEEQKFEFRIQVMQVLWNIKQCNSPLVPQS